MSKLNELADLVTEGENEEVEELVKACIEDGIDPLEILNVGLVEPINVLGEQFRLGEIYVPELLIAAEAMKDGVEVLKPHLLSGDIKKAGKMLIATIKGDVHDIGKNLVAMLMESAGFEVVDLGMDVDPDDIVEAIEEDEDIQILGMSAMLTTTMYAMQDTIEALEEEGLRDRLKIMIGGAPVNQTFADKIGADVYTADAASAVEAAKALLS
ncbi:MAG: corrinoid protein [Lachnospiraceae bacterium]|nr:corrinoid protein [Candidatus Equihabitans merdae]